MSIRRETCSDSSIDRWYFSIQRNATGDWKNGEACYSAESVIWSLNRGARVRLSIKINPRSVFAW
jgi:hypothetical protein